MAQVFKQLFIDFFSTIVFLAVYAVTGDILIATGVYRARAIEVPGNGAKGVVEALDYLTASNRKGFGDTVPAFDDGSLDAAGKHVVVVGGGKVIWPMIQQGRELSLELMSFDVAPTQDLYTNQGVAVNVEAVAQIKVKSDEVSIKTAAEQFLTKGPEERNAAIRLVMEGHLRGIVGQLTVEQIVKEPEMVADRMRANVAEDMAKMLQPEDLGRTIASWRRCRRTSASTRS